jgi:hypothetical protein
MGQTSAAVQLVSGSVRVDDLLRVTVAGRGSIEAVESSTLRARIESSPVLALQPL